MVSIQIGNARLPVRTYIVCTKKSVLSKVSSTRCSAPSVSRSSGNGVLMYDSGIAGGRPNVILSVLDRISTFSLCDPGRVQCGQKQYLSNIMHPYQVRRRISLSSSEYFVEEDVVCRPN